MGGGESPLLSHWAQLALAAPMVRESAGHTAFLDRGDRLLRSPPLPDRGGGRGGLWGSGCGSLRAPALAKGSRQQGAREGRGAAICGRGGRDLEAISAWQRRQAATENQMHMTRW